ncbi:MAG: CYTH domain-containing protein [Nanoarchaeota archaeon]
MNIEVEIRAFISKEKYFELLDFFKKSAKLLYGDNQETHYFKAPVDIRIQKNEFYSKIWLKKGAMHSEQREEIEIKCDKDDFDKLQNLFKSLNYETEIKWFRKRSAFEWKGITITLDYTKGYGYIIELEKLSNEKDKDSALNLLKEKLSELNIQQTPKEEFDKAYQNYKQNWKTLTQ